MGKLINKILGSRGKFFHYSDNEFTQLESKNKQNNKPLNVIPEVRQISDIDYNDNISLFVEPIPLDIIAGIYDNHPFWQSGKELFQYEIHTTDIPSKLFYRFVEMPSKSEWYEKHKDNESMTDEEYFQGLFDLQVARKEIGYNRNDMVNIAAKYIGKTRKAYIEAAKKNPKSEKYAAYVPHIMTYPLGGVIKVSDVRKVVIT